MSTGAFVAVYALYLYLLKENEHSTGLGPRPLAFETALSDRGDYLPYVMGRITKAPLFMWAGLGFVTKIGGHGGKGGDGGGAGEQLLYKEYAIHAITVGPAKALHSISEAGQTIFNTTLTPETDPSGSTFDTGVGLFQIYWGGDDNPDTSAFFGFDFMNFHLGVSSRWPYVCYVIWIGKVLGTAPVWPNLKYEIETLPTLAPIADVEPQIGGRGVNPAHILGQLMFAKYPHGIGIDKNDFDLGSLSAFAKQMEADDIQANMDISDGGDLQSVATDMLLDVGYFISFANGKYIFKEIREDSNWPTFTLDAVLKKVPEEKIFMEDGRRSNRVNYSFFDKDREYAVTTLIVPDDANAYLDDQAKPNSTPLRIATDLTTANIIAERRAQEEFGDINSLKLDMGRDARTLFPGRTFEVEGIDKLLRVVAVEIDPLSARTTIDAFVDTYGVLTSSFAADNGTAAVDPPEPVEDLEVEWYEPDEPNDHGGAGGAAGPALAVGRIRGNSNVAGAVIHASVDNVTYQEIATDEQLSTGGTLDDALIAATDFIIEQGPEFTIKGEDDDFIDAIRDFTGDNANWKAGRQIALINSEIFFVRNVTVISSTVARLDGLVRARFGTVREAHSVNDVVIITQLDQLNFYKDPLIVPGESVYLKVQPYVRGILLDLASVTAQLIPIVGKTVRPTVPINLRLSTFLLVYTAAEDLTFNWAYIAHKGRTNRTGAGMQGAGEAVGTTEDGTFTIRFFDGSTEVREVTGLTSPTYEYSAANRQSDFSALDTVTAKVFHVVNEIESASIEIDVLGV